MRLEDLLAQRKNEIIKDWFDRVVETYPADTAAFLKGREDPFANPVGGTIYKSFKLLYTELLKGIDHNVIPPLLDPIVRIRAVQNFTPSKAIGFIFCLKKVVRNHLNEKIKHSTIENELRLFEEKIDELSLIAFDLYMVCREKIYQLKANEVKNRTFKAFERAGLICEIPANELDPVKFNL
ncbi:MAG: RsbRD N-terminal domain-containing protein [Desulfobacterales bacterium]|jgi:hypothetical protein|nr:RsbRD N-terminal domain-containing protein [Desulfobacterales bacterium]